MLSTRASPRAREPKSQTWMSSYRATRRLTSSVIVESRTASELSIVSRLSSPNKNAPPEQGVSEVGRTECYANRDAAELEAPALAI